MMTQTAGRLKSNSLKTNYALHRIPIHLHNRSVPILHTFSFGSKVHANETMKEHYINHLNIPKILVNLINSNLSIKDKLPSWPTPL